jgi:hypothetical protein
MVKTAMMAAVVTLCGIAATAQPVFRGKVQCDAVVDAGRRTFDLTGCVEATPAPAPTPTPAPQPSPTPSPIPTPTPTEDFCACKPFARWGLAKPGQSSSKWLKDGRQVNGPQLGGAGYFDSVQRFGSGNGQPCDSDHPDNCRCPDGRVPLCEDERGPVWTLEGPGRLTVEGEWGFQARVSLNGRGHYKLRVCPRNPLLDGYGRVVPLAPGACGVFEWDVR